MTRAVTSVVGRFNIQIRRKRMLIEFPEAREVEVDGHRVKIAATTMIPIELSIQITA